MRPSTSGPGFGVMSIRARCAFSSSSGSAQRLREALPQRRYPLGGHFGRHGVRLGEGVGRGQQADDAPVARGSGKVFGLGHGGQFGGLVRACCTKTTAKPLSSQGCTPSTTDSQGTQ